ncbi:MAG: O-antigen ligase family protein [Thermoleophilia bacterium]
MSVSGGAGPQGVADRSSGAPQAGQPAGPGAGAARGPVVAGVAALVGWALLATGGGGIDPGDGLGGPGPRAAFLALLLGAPLAGAVAVMAWDRRALRARPSLLAIGALAGLTAWSALSITWAAGPDLAWIDANRLAIGLCALVIGAGLGALVPRAPLALGLGLTAAAALPVAIALLTKVLPEWLGADADLARLSAPLGYWNALAMVAVAAAPGAVWLAGGRLPWRWGLPVAAGALVLVILTTLLTYSRGGVLALAMAVSVTMAFTPARGRALAALGAAVLGAGLPAVHALTDPVLTEDGVPVDVRSGAALGLGWRIVVGVALAALLAPGIVALGRRTGLDPRRAGRAALAALVAVVVVGVVVVAAVPSARGWADERVGEFRGDTGDAVANDPGRLVNTAGNQRRGWWGESWRAFLDAPIAGQGAGGFTLVHLQERRTGDDSLQTREAHGILPGVLSGTGIVGLLLLAVFAVAVVWGVLRAATGRAPPEIGLPLAIIAAFVLQAAVDFSWQIPALTVPALAAVGVLLAAASPGREPAARPRPGGLAAGALVALVLVGVVSAALPWWSAQRVLAGEDALADRRPETALRLAQDARAANPLSPRPLFLMARAYTDLGRPARALGAYRAATDLQPDNPATWRALAVFLGPDRRAAAAWAEVLRLDPRDDEAALRS